MRSALVLIVLIAGLGLELVAVLGLCVMRNPYDRLHYVGQAGFGALLVALSVLIRQSFSLIGDKALLVGAMLVLTGPVVVQTTVRSLLIRERGDYRDCTEQQPRG